MAHKNLNISTFYSEYEGIASFITDKDYYVKRFFIIPKSPDIGFIDIAEWIEETLHRLIDAGVVDEGIFEMLGAEKIAEDNPFDEDEDYYIDLDYFIKGHLLQIFKEPNIQSVAF